MPPSADAALEREELGLRALALLVLVQGERSDLEYSLTWASQLTDAEHARRDQAMTWFCRLGLLEAGAPHFCLTRRGDFGLRALRSVGRRSRLWTSRLSRKLGATGGRRLRR